LIHDEVKVHDQQFGNVDHLLRHSLDKILVLTASLIGKYKRIWTITWPGKQLI
jgi:hypothetical protein